MELQIRINWFFTLEHINGISLKKITLQYDVLLPYDNKIVNRNRAVIKGNFRCFKAHQLNRDLLKDFCVCVLSEVIWDNEIKNLIEPKIYENKVKHSNVDNPYQYDKTMI